jgi:hypothetical protein
MRTTNEIDDRLMGEQRGRFGARTREPQLMPHFGLVQIHAQGSIRSLRGKVRVEGNLDKSRLSRTNKNGTSALPGIIPPAHLGCEYIRFSGAPRTHLIR